MWSFRSHNYFTPITVKPSTVHREVSKVVSVKVLVVFAVNLEQIQWFRVPGDKAHPGTRVKLHRLHHTLSWLASVEVLAATDSEFTERKCLAGLGHVTRSRKYGGLSGRVSCSPRWSTVDLFKLKRKGFWRIKISNLCYYMDETKLYRLHFISYLFFIQNFKNVTEKKYIF